MSDSVGSVSVSVVPDASLWAERLRAQIRDTTAEVKAEADTEEANLELDKTARTRTAKIKADVSQVSQASSFLDKFIGQLGLLPALAITAGSALIPLAAALGGVVAALGAPLAIAGGGVGIFAVLGSAAVAETNKQLKLIQTTQKSLDGLTKGTAAYTAKAKELKAQQAALSPVAVKYEGALASLKHAFDGLLQGKTGDALLGTIASGIDALAKALPLVAPLIQSVGGALSTLVGDLSKAAEGPGFARFMALISRQAGPDILAFAHIAGNGIKGLTGILLGFDQAFGGGILHGLERLSGSFANLGASAGHSKWLRDFVDYFHKVGPQVASTLGALARAFGHIVAALAPLGPPVLHIIQGIADAFSSIPIPVLTGIAGAAAGLVAFQKLGGFKVAGLVAKLAGGSTGGAGSLLTGGVQKVWVVNPGFGSGGSVGGKVGSFLEKTVPGGLVVGGEALTVGGAGAIAGTVAVAAATAFGLWKAWQDESNNNIHPGAGDGGPNGPMTQQDWRRHEAERTNALFGPGTVPVPPQIKSVGTNLDSLRAQVGRASTAIDLIGPRAEQASAAAVRALASVVAELAAIHPTKVQVIAETADAIRRLQLVQDYQIHDKSFNVYQRNQILERTVGPGGGIGQHNPGGSAGGGSGGGASMGGRTHVHVHLDDSGKATLSGFMDDHYQANASADQRFANTRAMR